jgi:hypothetical protein
MLKERSSSKPQFIILSSLIHIIVFIRVILFMVASSTDQLSHACYIIIVSLVIQEPKE